MYCSDLCPNYCTDYNAFVMLASWCHGHGALSMLILDWQILSSLSLKLLVALVQMIQWHLQLTLFPLPPPPPHPLGGRGGAVKWCLFYFIKSYIEGLAGLDISLIAMYCQLCLKFQTTPVQGLLVFTEKKKAAAYEWLVRRLWSYTFIWNQWKQSLLALTLLSHPEGPGEGAV